MLDAVLATLLPRGYHSAAGIAGVIADQVPISHFRFRALG